MLTRPGRLDELTVLVETLAEMPEADRAAVAGRLMTQVKDRIGTTCTVEVRGPGGIERSVGKARRVVEPAPALAADSGQAEQAGAAARAAAAAR